MASCSLRIPAIILNIASRGGLARPLPPGPPGARNSCFAGFSWLPRPAPARCAWRLAHTRGLRTRVVVSNFDHSHFVVTNPKTAGNWPPEHDHGAPVTRESCRKLMFELNQLEVERMEKMRKFNVGRSHAQMPELSLGDLVEVKYELSRTQQTFAVFTGYCVDIRKRGLNSSFSLKNAFDGVGVTQLVPLYSPRILNVKVGRAEAQILKSLNRAAAPDRRPPTRDYRYRFHRNVRHRFARRSGVHKPGAARSRAGIRSFEVRLKNRVTRLKQSYYRMRLEAGLPAYVWGGPYNISTRRRARWARDIRRLVRGETYRRIQLYSLVGRGHAQDEQRARSEKLSRRRRRTAWGNYRLPGTEYLRKLDGK